MTPEPGLDLRLIRTFVAVAQRRSFTRAADDLHVAQQAVSQQIKALERALGVTLLRRTPRRVQLTAEGAVFLTDSRRVLAAADRATRRVQAAAQGEVGTLRLAYTLTTVWDTTPALLSRLEAAHPQLKVVPREVFGADIAELLLTERVDLAIAPLTSYPRGVHAQTVRREPARVAVSDDDPLARRKRVKLATLAKRPFQLWPRDMAPGFYDTVVGACHAAGFEPTLDDQAAGNTVWGNLARGRGVALINASIASQLPRGITLIELEPPAASFTYEVVWRHGAVAAIRRARETAAELAGAESWL